MATGWRAPRPPERGRSLRLVRPIPTAHRSPIRLQRRIYEAPSRNVKVKVKIKVKVKLKNAEPFGHSSPGRGNRADEEHQPAWTEPSYGRAAHARKATGQRSPGDPAIPR
jgi:hypothetical protein